MAKTHSQAVIDYNRSRDNLMCRPTIEEGKRIRAAAARSGMSVQAYMLDAVRCRMESEQAAPWVSVTDRLPSKVGAYLVCESDGNIETVDYHAAANTPGEFYRYVHGGIEPLADVTHWQPLPAPPTVRGTPDSDTADGA